MSICDVACRDVEGVLTLLEVLAKSRDKHRIVRSLGQGFETLGELVRSSPLRRQELCRSASAAALLGEPSALSVAHCRARSILELAEASSVDVISLWGGTYPARLRELADAPVILYAKGRLRPGLRSVACVGTRRPSRFGVVVTKRIVMLLASRGWTIVSGLACGVDALAHRAALHAGGYTVAVLGHGLDSVYPKQNEKLALDVLDCGGALLSEEPPGVRVSSERLVRRDRLQSGLASAVVLLQSDLRGGALHTVRFALVQGRPLFVPVPTGAHAQERQCRALVLLVNRQGAELVEPLSASGELAVRLRGELAASRIAWPIGGRKDYPRLLDELEGVVGRLYNVVR